MEKRKKMVMYGIGVAIALLATVAAIVLINQNYAKKAQKNEITSEQQKSGEQVKDDSDEIQAQLKQLESLRVEQGAPQQVDEKQVQDQLKQLNAMQKEKNIQVPTQQQVQDQLEQLEALRNSGK